MADYFVSSAGSNTSPYETWAKAATSLATALAAATTTGDRVIIQYDGVPSGDAEAAANVTHTIAGNVAVISASNDGGSSFTPTAMGATYWLGNSTTSRGIAIVGTKNAYFYGLTFRIAGSGPSNLTIGNTAADALHFEFDNCYLWQGSSDTTTRIATGNTGNGSTNTYVRFLSCAFRFGSTGGAFALSGTVSIEGGSIASAGSAPTVLFTDPSAGFTYGTTYVEGADLSHVTGTLVGSHANRGKIHRFVNCKFGSGVTVLANQTPANKGSAIAKVFDCSSGDEHYKLEYHDAFGSLTTDVGIYANDGAQYDGTNRCSWKIVTTANCAYYTPFVSPWFDVYHSGTSAVTPSIEILRNGSTTAYQDDEVWGEWSYKGTTGSTKTTLINDRKALEASAANQGAGVGTSGWTGDTGAWSGKLVGASITPAEIGHIRGRVYVGEPSITVYVDPQTRLA